MSWSLPCLLAITLLGSGACSGDEIDSDRCDVPAVPTVTTSSDKTGSLVLQLRQGGVVEEILGFQDQRFLVPAESLAAAVGNPNLPQPPRSAFSGLRDGVYKADFVLVEQRQGDSLLDVNLEMTLEGRKLSLSGPIGFPCD